MRTCLWCHEADSDKGLTNFVCGPCALRYRGPTGKEHVEVETERRSWPACARCAPMVMRADALALARRAIRRAKRRTDDPVASMRVDDFAALYGQVLDQLERPDAERLPS